MHCTPAEQSAPQVLADAPCPLQVDVPRLQRAISVACRLGFAKRLPNRNEGGAAQSCFLPGFHMCCCRAAQGCAYQQGLLPT